MQENDRVRMYGFLHDKGYDFFNINRLTIMEVNMLIKDFKNEQRERNKAVKKAQRKRKW